MAKKKNEVKRKARVATPSKSRRSSSAGSAKSHTSAGSGGRRTGSRSGSARNVQPLDGKTVPSGEQPTPGRLAKETSAATKKQMDDAYLAGFLDPCLAARGPAMSDDPTIVSVFSSTQNITLTSSAGLSPAPWPADTTLHCSSTGAIAIAVGPVAFMDKTAGTTNLKSGFLFPASRVLTNAAFPVTAPTNGVSGAKPLGAYRQSDPGTFQAFTSADFNAARDGIYSMAFRILGIKATLTVTENAFTATGEVLAGDSASYYPDPPVFKYALNSVGNQESTSVAYSDNADMFTRPNGLDDGRSTQRIVPVGAFETGRSFEAVYLPTSSTITNFRSMFPVHATPAAVGNVGTSIGQPLLDGPFVLFALQGTSSKSGVGASTTNFVLTSEVAMEWIVKYDNAFALLMGEARYMPGWIPDFSRLAMISPGGRLGHIAARYSKTELHGHYVKHPMHASRAAQNQQAAALGKAMVHTSTMPANAVIAEAVKRKPTSTLEDVLAFAQKIGPDVFTAVKAAGQVGNLALRALNGSGQFTPFTGSGPLIEEILADAPLLLL